MNRRGFLGTAFATFALTTSLARATLATDSSGRRYVRDDVASTVAYSDDGVTWTTKTDLEHLEEGAPISWRSVSFDQDSGRFYALGDQRRGL
jgi:phosphodiesterase/alkaline phosphatase D-like protein